MARRFPPHPLSNSQSRLQKHLEALTKPLPRERRAPLENWLQKTYAPQFQNALERLTPLAPAHLDLVVQSVERLISPLFQGEATAFPGPQPPGELLWWNRKGASYLETRPVLQDREISLGNTGLTLWLVHREAATATRDVKQTPEQEPCLYLDPKRPLSWSQGRLSLPLCFGAFSVKGKRGREKRRYLAQRAANSVLQWLTIHPGHTTSPITPGTLETILFEAFGVQYREHFFLKDPQRSLWSHYQRSLGPQVEAILQVVPPEQVGGALRELTHLTALLLEHLERELEKEVALYTAPPVVQQAQLLLSLDRIPHRLRPEVLQSGAQQRAWRELYGDLAEEEGFHALNPVVDTSHHSQTLREALFSSLKLSPEGTLPTSLQLQELDGLLIHSDNLPALRFLHSTLAGKVRGVYIDPPYNTGEMGFAYKDHFSHEAWLSMMGDRLSLTKTLLSREGSLYISINETELFPLKLLCDQLGYN